MANDPELLEAFAYNFEHCKSGLKKLEPKTVELLLLALGCAKGKKTTIVFTETWHIRKELL